jgi:hypothetical protein
MAVPVIYILFLPFVDRSRALPERKSTDWKTIMCFLLRLHEYYIVLCSAYQLYLTHMTEYTARNMQCPTYVYNESVIVTDFHGINI